MKPTIKYPTDDEKYPSLPGGPQDPGDKVKTGA